MKKIAITLILISIFYLTTSNILAQNLTIPEDAIRVRVIPNSNEEYDQKIKANVKDELSVEMYNLLKDVKTSQNAKEIIEQNLEEIKKSVSKTLQKENYNKDFKVNFGYNYFPEKKYKGVTYEEGYYESLLVTLGEGKGDNWWCVLFPPLCLIEADESQKDIEYKSLIKEILDKYL